ncbi:MAG: hypothetical protein L3K14_01825 [Thermoplasmata archaeon]|nr:hypothetical protein [Thermoplasmata archaeon]
MERRPVDPWLVSVPKNGALFGDPVGRGESSPGPPSLTRLKPCVTSVRLDVLGGLDRRRLESRPAAGTGRRTALPSEDAAAQLFPVDIDRTRRSRDVVTAL